MHALKVEGHRRLACRLLLMLVTGGCVGHPINEHQPYPRTMPSLATAPVGGECPDVSGTYASQAAEAWPEGLPGGRTLQSLLTSVYVQGRITTAFTAKQTRAIQASATPLYDLTAETVHLTLENGRLEVRYVAKDQANATIAFIRGGILTPGPRFQCSKFDEGPGLQLWPFIAYEDFVMPVQAGVFGGSNTAVVLYKAVDGSLVVRLQAESGFTILLVPYIRTDSEWLRFGVAGQARKGPEQKGT